RFLLLLPTLAVSRKCDTIYKGFAECLISLGDSMCSLWFLFLHFCRSWDDFHTCASGVLSRCPEEAAAIWESLRQESRKIQFQGNLHDLCSARARSTGSGRDSDTVETNKETLRASAWFPKPWFLAGLTLLALALLAPFA
uniref:Neuritin 1 like n=1 Tax=Sphenodon punctatus TaxID=8508 RepID=A0A8D0HDM2_SPHPU